MYDADNLNPEIAGIQVTMVDGRIELLKSNINRVAPVPLKQVVRLLVYLGFRV